MPPVRTGAIPVNVCILAFSASCMDRKLTFELPACSYDSAAKAYLLVIRAWTGPGRCQLASWSIAVRLLTAMRQGC